MTNDELAYLLADGLETLASRLRASAQPAVAAPSPKPEGSGVARPVAAPTLAAGRTKPWTHDLDLSDQEYKWPGTPKERYGNFPVYGSADARGNVRVGIGYADEAAI